MFFRERFTKGTQPEVFRCRSPTHNPGVDLLRSRGVWETQELGIGGRLVFFGLVKSGVFGCFLVFFGVFLGLFVFFFVLLCFCFLSCCVCFARKNPRNLSEKHLRQTLQRFSTHQRRPRRLWVGRWTSTAVLWGIPPGWSGGPANA